MYLTQLEINPLRRQARRLLANPQVMHAVIMRICSPENGERVLWRIDDTDAGVFLYLVSPQPPKIADLNAEIGWPRKEAKTVSYVGLLDSLREGDCYAFRLTANPVHTVTIAGRKKRYGHVTVQQQKEWFLRKAEIAGFTVRKISADADEEIPDFIVHGRKIQTFQRQGKALTINTASFSGTLCVVDPVLLRKALVEGIGPAKAYGCGLLTLARII